MTVVQVDGHGAPGVPAPTGIHGYCYWKIFTTTYQCASNIPLYRTYYSDTTLHTALAHILITVVCTLHDFLDCSLGERRTPVRA